MHSYATKVLTCHAKHIACRTNARAFHKSASVCKNNHGCIRASHESSRVSHECILVLHKCLRATHEYLRVSAFLWHMKTFAWHVNAFVYHPNAFFDLYYLARLKLKTMITNTFQTDKLVEHHSLSWEISLCFQSTLVFALLLVSESGEDKSIWCDNAQRAIRTIMLVYTTMAMLIAWPENKKTKAARMRIVQSLRSSADAA